MTRLIGYARVSTTDQEAGLSAQLRELCAVVPPSPVGHVVHEMASAVGERPVLDRAVTMLGAGDVLVVTKLDRLARNVAHLCEIVERIKARGASLRILAMGLDTGTPTGTLMLNVLGAVAQFEREIMLERQREGIAKAKAAGKYRGRAAKHDPEAVKRDVAFLSEKKGWDTGSAIAETALVRGMSVRQVQRIVRGK